MSLAIALLVFGFILVIAELLFIPGGVVGVIGGLCGIFAIYMGFEQSQAAGFTLLFVGLVTYLGGIYLLFKTGTYKWLTVKTELKSKVNQLDSNLKLGDSGKAITRLNPYGKVDFNGNITEVKAENNFVDEGVQVIICNFTNNIITVKPQ